MMALRRILLSVTLLGLAWSAAGSADDARPARGFADPLLGRWDLTIEGDDGPYPSWLEVQLRTEWQLMGRFVGRFGSVRHVHSLDYRDGRMRFDVPVQYEAHTVALRFDGTLDDDQLHGVTFDSDGEALRFSGVRAPALRRERMAVAGTAVELFNGRNLDGWRSRSAEHMDCWRVVDGVLTATPPCVDLVSEATFDDFRVQVDFRYPQGSNSGLYLRGRYEVQIQDDHGHAVDPLRMGGVYGFIAPAVDAAKAAGEWQHYDITLRGRRITVALNGTTIIEGREIPGITGGALDSNEAMPGPLMLQGDHGPVEFRQITLTPLR